MSTARISQFLLTKTSDRAAVERHRRRTPAVLIGPLLVAFSGQVFANTPDESPSTGDLKQLSVEELMNLEVTSVSKQPQKLGQAAY